MLGHGGGSEQVPALMTGPFQKKDTGKRFVFCDQHCTCSAFSFITVGLHFLPVYFFLASRASRRAPGQLSGQWLRGRAFVSRIFSVGFARVSSIAEMGLCLKF